MSQTGDHGGYHLKIKIGLPRQTTLLIASKMAGHFRTKKDGTVFQNREGRLPDGNYREYTVETPGASNRGARRIVRDKDTGRTFYTDDHYENFVEIDPTRR
jgi:guanyl-specific ribonuclease Sa